MDLTCYVYSGWKPRIRPASSRRDWMDGSPESFAYRCLPLNIANAHGWEMLSPCGFEAMWNGGPRVEDVTIRVDEGAPAHEVPVAIFGQGVVTFHVSGIYRTPPGWNLWVGGPPNAGKDGIAPLGGVVETDWSPFSFTMNWRFTRANEWVRFEENEPFCFFFPVQRGVLDGVTPRIAPIDEAPELKEQFETWSKSRDAFQAAVAANPPAEPADKWQKLYYRGADAHGRPGAADHQSKLRLPAFQNAPALPEPRCPVRPQPRPEPVDDLARRKREWVLETQQRLRTLSPQRAQLFRRERMDGQTFLDDHYALNLPVVVADAVKDWPAAWLWTPDYLRAKIGFAPVEVQAGRDSSEEFERHKDAHRTTMPFGAFIDRVAQGAGNDLYLTAYNSSANAEALAPLNADLGSLDELMEPGGTGMMWIGPANTFTPLHHDLTNNLLMQVVGRKRVVLAPPSASARLYNDRHVFSMVHDILAEDLDLEAFPLLNGVRLHDMVLEPGDALFVPVGWWHQVRSLDFSISITRTDFRWPNDAYESWPSA